ncbi:MAG: carboxypeptidase-like regulatory domain-containing protein [Bacteroidales bacterium]|nr:carboxypeptidase-like regulatory domain-containing protein [Bacteroidales bacterium]MBN2818617.1 carboxypeptidase-like regulatory domain-containing protein [Bacteroidales bacterium]
MTVLLLFSVLLSAQDVLKQSIYIDIPESKRIRFLDSIRSVTGFELLYSSAINPEKKVVVPVGEYTINSLLDSVFNDQELNYIVKDGLIILSPLVKQSVENKNVIVEGKVYGKREKAIPFATIYFERLSRGTIANSDGEFRFIVPERNLNDTITITCMGYNQVKVPPHIYLTQRLDIELSPISIPIKSIIIRPTNPNEIIRKSVEAIGKNYLSEPVLLTAFFRETSKQNEDYISLTEALIEINKSSYLSSAEDLIRLIKGRNGTNIKKSELVNLTVEGGLYNGLRLDIAKYNSNFYSSNSREFTDYRYVKSMHYKGREVYIIDFVMRENTQFQEYKGTLYIDAESLALVRAEFEITSEGLEFAKDILVKKTPRGFNARPLFARYEVEYRFYNDVWNLYYAHSEIGIKVRKRHGKENKGYSCDFISTSDFVITGIITEPNYKIRYKEAVKPGDVLVDQVRNTSETFWIEDNIILPEEPLQKTITRLQEEGVINTDENQ